MSVEAMAKLGLDQSRFQMGLASAQASAEKFASGISRTMGTLGATIVGAFAFDRIVSGLNNAIAKGDQLQDLANRFGVSATALQEIGNTATLSGASLEDVAGAMNKLARNAGQAIGGNEQLQHSFAKIGLSVEQLKTMNPEELFLALSRAVSSGTLGSQDFAVAMELAGRGAGSLLETLRLGPDVILENGRAMGTWSNETIAALSEASDNIKQFQNNLTIAFGKVIPILDRVIRRYQDLAEAFILSGNARRNPDLDELARAELFQQAGDLVSGRTGRTTEKPSAPTKPRATGAGDLEEAQANFKQQQQAKKDAEELQDLRVKLLKDEDDFKRTMLDRDLADARRARESERDSAYLLAQAQRDLAMLLQQRQREERANRGIRGARAAGATEILDRTSSLGDPALAASVDRERNRMAEEARRNDRRALDRAVRANTPEFTDEGARRSMASRRSEFIAQQAKTEARGGKTLTDVYQALQDTLSKITSTPIVGAN